VDEVLSENTEIVKNFCKLIRNDVQQNSGTLTTQDTKTCRDCGSGTYYMLDAQQQRQGIRGDKTKKS